MGLEHYQYAGAVVPPTAPSTAGSLLSACDPTLEGLLGAFKDILNTKLGTAWAAAASGFSSAVVVDTYHYDPIPQQALETWQWPALAMWRAGGKLSERTLEYDVDDVDLECVYVLPPLTNDQISRLSPILLSVVRTLRGFVEHKGDSSYDSGSNFLEDLDIDSLTLVEYSMGEAFPGFNTSMKHPGVRMKFLLREREMFNETDIDDLSALPTQIDVEDSSGTTESVVEIDYDPTE